MTFSVELDLDRDLDFLGDSEDREALDFRTCLFSGVGDLLIETVFLTDEYSCYMAFKLQPLITQKNES